MTGLLMVLAVFGTGFAPVPRTGEDHIRWRPERRLNWSDFQARPERGTGMDAQTESGISFSWSCDWRGFEMEAYAMMVPSKSWVKKESKYLLAHEQAHFDITEVHARKLRKFFGEKRDPCSMGKAAINQGAERILSASFAMQNTYDRETQHGYDEAEQARWLKKIAGMLKELEAWAE